MNHSNNPNNPNHPNHPNNSFNPSNPDNSIHPDNANVYNDRGFNHYSNGMEPRENRSIWSTLLKVVIALATALASAFGLQSCL